MHEVRQSGFKIHRIARVQIDELTKNILRVIGHAVASEHMKELMLIFLSSNRVIVALLLFLLYNFYTSYQLM